MRACFFPTPPKHDAGLLFFRLPGFFLSRRGINIRGSTSSFFFLSFATFHCLSGFTPPRHRSASKSKVHLPRHCYILRVTIPTPRQTPSHRFLPPKKSHSAPPPGSLAKWLLHSKTQFGEQQRIREHIPLARPNDTKPKIACVAHAQFFATQSGYTTPGSFRL